MNNISLIYSARGDYERALTYLEQSLEIRREIGDRSGLCGTVINIGHIYWTNGEKEKAMAKWLSAYKIAKEMGWAEALSNLENLAKQIGGSGLAFWEELV
ncbi:hypothetical protein GMMP13_810001 [Candidatus Magnetomoraceae bacterium gMMP-13]